MRDQGLGFSHSVLCILHSIGIAFETEFGDILRMPKGSILAFVLFFAAASFGQSVPVSPLTASAEAARAEFMNTKFWSKIGEFKDESKGFVLFSRNLLPNPEGQIEFWVKIAPKNTDDFNKRFGLPANAAFVLQYATVDCSKRFLSLERTAIYDAGNQRLGSGSGELTPKTSRDRTKPGSIGAEIYASICERLE